MASTISKKTSKQSADKNIEGSTTSKPRSKVNLFHQRLGSLTVYQAGKLLGEGGLSKLSKGAQAFEIDFDRDVFLGGDLLRICVPDSSLSIQSRREGVATATGQLVSAALALAGQLLQKDSTSQPSSESIEKMTQRLSSLVETDAEGRPQITISLPDIDALRSIATTLARLIG